MQGDKGRSENPGSSGKTTLLHTGFGSTCPVSYSQSECQLTVGTGLGMLLYSFAVLLPFTTTIAQANPGFPGFLQVSSHPHLLALVLALDVPCMWKPFRSFSAQSGPAVLLTLVLQLSAPWYYPPPRRPPPSASLMIPVLAHDSSCCFLPTMLRIPSPPCPADPQKSLPHFN